jgi:hypothetical protein
MENANGKNERNMEQHENIAEDFYHHSGVYSDICSR